MVMNNEQINSTLSHFGVLGMKWGVRKDRNVDVQIKKSRRADVRSRRRLSDKELLEKIGRLEKEKKLRELTDSELNAGKTAVREILKSSGSKVATAALTGAAIYGIKAILTKSFNPVELAKSITIKKN